MSDNASTQWSNPVGVPAAKRVMQQVDRLFADNQLDKALDLLQSAWPGLPSDRVHNSRIEAVLIRAVLQARLGQFEAALATVRALLHCNVSLNLNSLTFESLRTLDGYAELAKQNSELLTRERAEAHVRWEASKPDDPVPNRPAPLMLVLHGDPGNLHKIRTMWPHDPATDRGALVAYVQSSQLLSTTRYMWSADPAIAWSDLQAAYEEICSRYAVDESRVILAGFSSGATMALDLAFGQGLPAAGFIGLCPGEVPAHFDHEQIIAARDRGMRGVFLDSEDNWPDDDQRELMDSLRGAGFPIEVILHAGAPHDAPPNFADRLRDALGSVLQ